MIQSRGIRQAGHIACMGNMKNAYKILVRKSEGIDGRIILEWMSGK
jgi:hypothetical protein